MGKNMSDLKLTFNVTMRFQVSIKHNGIYNVILSGMTLPDGQLNRRYQYYTYVAENLTRKSNAERITNAGNQFLAALYPPYAPETTKSADAIKTTAPKQDLRKSLWEGRRRAEKRVSKTRRKNA